MFINAKKTYTMKEVEGKLLTMYSRRRIVSQSIVERFFEELVSTNFPMNDVCSSGPLFCFILDLKPFLSLNVIKSMVDGGLDFSNIHMRGVAHRKLIREIEISYSDKLWGIFIFLCQNTNFVQTIPATEMFDILFGKIIIHKGGISTEFEPQLVLFNILLAYDKRKHRIKKVYLHKTNFSLRHCIRQKFPLISNAILDS